MMRNGMHIEYSGIKGFTNAPTRWYIAFLCCISAVYRAHVLFSMCEPVWCSDWIRPGTGTGLPKFKSPHCHATYWITLGQSLALSLICFTKLLWGYNRGRNYVQCSQLLGRKVVVWEIYTSIPRMVGELPNFSSASCLASCKTYHNRDKILQLTLAQSCHLGRCDVYNRIVILLLSLMEKKRMVTNTNADWLSRSAKI